MLRVVYNDKSICVESFCIILLIYSTALVSLSKYLINVCPVYRDVMKISICGLSVEVMLHTENLTIQPFLTIGKK